MIFILTILYAVSSINILLILVNVLPFLEGVFRQTHILSYFAEIAFGLSVFLSIYHISIMFHKKELIGLLPTVLFVLIVLYAIFSLYVLACILGHTSHPMGNDDLLWVGFAVVSFALATLISVFHLITMMFRRKRETDNLIQSHLDR